MERVTKVHGLPVLESNKKVSCYQLLSFMTLNVFKFHANYPYSVLNATAEKTL
jgi:hypothetical protein